MEEKYRNMDRTSEKDMVLGALFSGGNTVGARTVCLWLPSFALAFRDFFLLLAA